MLILFQIIRDNDEKGIMIIRNRYVLRFFSTILCTTGLLYQSYQLLSEYMSGKSVVNIKLMREIYSNLPAITLCYPKLISMEMAANYSDIYRDYYYKYKNIIELIGENSTMYDLHKDNMTMLHQMFHQQIFYISPFELFKVLFNNLSLSYKYDYFNLFFENDTFYYKRIEKSIINIGLKGNIYGQNYSVLFKSRYKNSPYFHEDRPIDSVNYNHRVKCFTFFSVINLVWNTIKFNLQQMTISMENNIKWFPPHLIDKYYLAIHSSNIIPEFNVGLEFVEIEPNAEYSVSFAKIDIDRYYSHTQTNCIDYRRNNYRELRSDCIAECILRKSHDENIHLAPLHMKTLLRKENIDLIEKPRLNFAYSNALERLPDITQDCHLLCKHDCKHAYFIYDIKMNNNYTNSDPTKKHSLITLQHNRLPDLFVRHIPEITFVSFIGNFGGLLGMWLGFNALMIFDIAYKIIKRIIKIIGKTDEEDNRLFIQRNQYLINPKFTQIVKLS